MKKTAGIKFNAFYVFSLFGSKLPFYIAQIVINCILAIVFKLGLAGTLKYVTDSATSGDLKVLWFGFFIGIGSIMVSSIFFIIIIYYMNKTILNVFLRYKLDFFKKMLNTRTSELEKQDAGIYLSRINDDIGAAADFANSNTFDGSIPYTIQMLAAGLVSCFVIFVSNWIIGIAAVLVAIISVFISRLFNKTLEKANKNMREKTERTLSAYEETVSNYEDAKSFNAEQIMDDRFSSRIREYYRAAGQKSWVDIFYQLFNTIIVNFNWQGIILIGGIILFANGISLGNVMGIFILTETIGQTLRCLLTYKYRSKAAYVSLQRVEELKNLAQEERGHYQPAGDTAIEFGNVSFAYNENKKIIKDLSFKVMKNMFLGITGESGEGKSTIFMLIMGLYSPSGGKISLFGNSISPLNTEARKDVTPVFQTTWILEGTVAENIRLGNPAACDSEIEEAAKKAQAHEFISKLPQKYNTIIGKSGHALSGGEMQRISVARAFISRAPVTVLDEIMSDIDNQSVKLLIEALEQMRKEKTVILITHKAETLKNADVVMEISA